MAQALHEAWFSEKQSDGRIRCSLCPHDCRITEGSRGACAVRFNQQGVLYTFVHDRVVAASVEAIEKKPLFHFQPGSLAYSVATVGCNQQCTFCQNWRIAQWPREHLPRRLAGAAGDSPLLLAALAQAIPGVPQSPDAMADAAVKAGASSIAYTFTEPTIYFELAYETAVRARARGLKNVFVSNGYINEGAVRHIAPLLDAINIDLKFFREPTYRRLSKAGLRPVLEAIRLYHRLGVWVEITTLVIPGINDSDLELRQIAEFIRSVSPTIPWHVTRFYPTYRMADREATPPERLERARDIGARAGLLYVYEGNVPGNSHQNTVCPECRTIVIEREGCAVRANRLKDGCCPACETHIDGVDMEGSGRWAARPVG